MSKQYYFDGLVMENILSFFEKGKHSVKLALTEGVYVKLINFDLSEERLAANKRTHSHMTQLARFKIVSRTNKTLMVSLLVNGIWSIPRRKKIHNDTRFGESIEFHWFSVCGKDKMTCIYDEKEWKKHKKRHKKEEKETKPPDWCGHCRQRKKDDDLVDALVALGFEDPGRVKDELHGVLEMRNQIRRAARFARERDA